MNEIKVNLLCMENLNNIYKIDIYVSRADLEDLNKLCLLKGISLEVVKQK